MDREYEGAPRESEEAATPIAAFDLRLLGPVEARLGGKPLPHLRARAGLSLLALLALRPHRALERSWLAAMLWPDSSEDQALYNLRRNLVDVRRVLGEQAYRLESPTPRTLRLDFTGGFCDVHVFDAACHSSQTTSKKQRQEAIALYRGPLLEGWTNEWVFAESEARQQSYLDTLEALAAEAIQDGDPAEAVHRLEQLLAADPYREAAHRTLMETLAAMGDRAAAMFAYREFRHLLMRELHSEPSPETQALHQRLRRSAQEYAQERDATQERSSGLFGVPKNLEHGNQRPSLTASPKANAISSGLPSPLTSLIGRIGDTWEVREALRTARLVTLTGTGGVGKTRLALAVAEEMGDEFPAGIWFADLAPIRDGESVPHAVAAALGLCQDTDIMPEEVLCGFIRQKRLLLILDNGEHIADACARLATDMLRACPLLRILCTSRQPLYVPGEAIWMVAPLGIPPAPTASDDPNVFAADLANYESVALLLDRAKRASPAFRLTPRNAPAVAQICRQLDGLPLALELVAARFRSLSALEIASRLDSRFRLSASGDPARARHRTLQAALDWSYDLLNEAERRLLRGLTVFAGGWTLEAAESVCAEEKEESRDSAGTLPPAVRGGSGPTVLDLLTSLVDKSLVVYEEQEERGRYRLLETTREYASEHLSPDERRWVQTRYIDYFGHMVRLIEGSGTGFELPDWLDRMWIERDNFRAVHAWYREEDADTALWLEFILYGTRTWPVQNAQEWITRLQRQPAPPTPLGARIAFSVASWAQWLGSPASEELANQALDVARACGEKRWQMRAFALLTSQEEERGDRRAALEYAEATLACAIQGGETVDIAEYSAKAALHLWRSGEVDTARLRLQTLLEAARQSDDWPSRYFPLAALGEISLAEKEYAEARAYYDEALSLAERFLPSEVPDLWRSQAWVAASQQNYAAAWRCFEQALAASRQSHAVDREGWTRWDMAEVAFRQGDALQAQEQLGQCLSLFESLHETRSVVQCLYKFGKFCAGSRQPVRAVTLLASADRGYREEGITPDLATQDAIKNLAAELGDTLDQATWQTAWQYGMGMTLAEATTYALSAPTPS